MDKLKIAAKQSLNMQAAKGTEKEWQSFYEKLALRAFSNIYNGRKLDKYRANEWIDKNNYTCLRAALK